MTFWRNIIFNFGRVFRFYFCIQNFEYLNIQSGRYILSYPRGRFFLVQPPRQSQTSIQLWFCYWGHWNIIKQYYSGHKCPKGELSIYYRIITHLISARTSKTGHVFAIRGDKQKLTSSESWRSIHYVRTAGQICTKKTPPLCGSGNSCTYSHDSPQSDFHHTWWLFEFMLLSASPSEFCWIIDQFRNIETHVASINTLFARFCA